MVHASADDTELKEPGRHAPQRLVEPAPDEKVPAEHATQSGAPVPVKYAPTAQGAHVESVVIPVTLLAVPAGQGILVVVLGQ